MAALRHDPRRQRRIALAVAGGLVAALLLGAGWLRSGAPVPSVCDVGDAPLAGVWDGRRRAAVEAAFAQSGAPFASDAFASVVRTLDGYVSAWSRMRVDACAATRIRGEQSEHLMDLRMQCLERRRDGLRAQIDLFTKADRVVVAKAVEASHALAPLEDCADRTLLEATVPPPSDPATRDGVAAANHELARVTAELASGHYADGLRLVEPLVHTAEGLGYRPLWADVELRHGALLDRAGDYTAAQRAYEAAAIHADAGRADMVRAEALTQLVWVVGERQGHFQEARQLAKIALGAIDRLDRPERVLARYHRALGVLDYRQGRYREALQASQRATELARRALGPSDPYVASCVMDMGLARYFLGEYDAARADVQTALGVWRAAFGPNHADVAAAFDNLGEIDRAQRHYAEATANYREAAAIWERLGSADRADALANLGEVERLQGQLVPAKNDLERAVSILEPRFGADHSRLSAPLVSLARIAVEERQPARAVTLLERVLRIDDANPADPVDRADAEFALARALRMLARDAARAQSLARAALARYTAAGVRGSGAASEVRSWLAVAAR